MLGFYDKKNETITSLEKHNYPFKDDNILNESVWVDFEVDIDNKIIINKKYSSEIGTPKENVSLAFYRYEKNSYPLGSFKNGFENMFCDKCKTDYIGSFDSETCELCMLKNMIGN
jgi:hypothetical protein